MSKEYIEPKNVREMIDEIGDVLMRADNGELSVSNAASNIVCSTIANNSCDYHEIIERYPDLGVLVEKCADIEAEYDVITDPAIKHMFDLQWYAVHKLHEKLDKLV
jgi:hypothetical protein